MGIIGVVFAFIPFCYWIAYILGALALIFGIIGLVKKAGGHKALAATILGAVALVIGIVMNVLAVQAVNELAEELVTGITTSLEDYSSDALDNTAEVTLNGYVDYDGILADKALSVTVKNISDKTLSFAVSIEALDSNGNRIDESYVSAQDLAPGQSYTSYAFDYSSLDEEELENATFRVYRVSSF